MSQALNELRKIGENHPDTTSLIQHWIEKWVNTHHVTAVIDYEALKHLTDDWDYKQYQKERMLIEIGKTLEPIMSYEEELYPVPMTRDRLPDGRYMDLSVPMNLRMRFDLLTISENPKEET